MSEQTSARNPVREVVVVGDASGFAQRVHVGDHDMPADEPRDQGGTDSGPSPFELLLAALGSCTSMTVALYARRKQWPLASVTVTLRHTKLRMAGGTGPTDRIEREIGFIGALDEEQRARLLDIANKCPVHRTLTGEIAIESTLVGSTSALSS